MNHKTSILLQRLRKHASEIRDVDRVSIEQDISRYQELEQLVTGKLMHTSHKYYYIETSVLLSALNKLLLFISVEQTVRIHRLDADYQKAREIRDKEERIAYLQQLKQKRLTQREDDLVARHGMLG